MSAADTRAKEGVGSTIVLRKTLPRLRIFLILATLARCPKSSVAQFFLMMIRPGAHAP